MEFVHDVHSVSSENNENSCNISDGIFVSKTASTEWMSFQQMDIARISRPRDLFPQGFHKVSNTINDQLIMSESPQKW